MGPRGSRRPVERSWPERPAAPSTAGTARAPVRDRGPFGVLGGKRAGIAWTALRAIASAPCSSASTSAGPSPTRSSSTAARCTPPRLRPRPPTSPAASWRRSRACSSGPGAEAGAVDGFAHGMTVGTNALLEERGARTALVATEGLHRPAGRRPPGPPAALSALRAGARPARADARAALRRARARLRRRGGRRAPRRRGRPARRRAVRETRGRVGGRLPAVLVRRSGPRARRRRGAPRAAARRPRLAPRTRCCRSSASTSAARRP